MRYYLFAFIVLCSSLRAESVDELKKQVAAVLPQLYGWCTEEKAFHFIDLVLAVKPEVCVEIGVFGGRSLFPVASALKFLGDGLVIGVDPWSREECTRYFDPIREQAHLNWWSKVNMDQIYYGYLNMLAYYQLEEYCLTLRTTSEQAVAAIGLIDILYIDGNHSEKVITQDVQLYLPKVRPGGYIWLNDALWTEFQPAVDLLLDACDLVTAIDGGNCLLLKKR